MAIPVQQFRPLSFEEANPFLSGIQSGQNIYSNYLAQQLSKIQNQNELTKQKYLEPSLQEQLQKAMYENQIQKPMAENADAFTMAKLAAERAQAPHINAQTNRINTMTPLEAEQLRLQNQLYPQLTNAKIASMEAATNNKAITPLQKELGKQDAKFVGDLDKTYANSQKKLVTLDEVSNIVTSPEFQQIRQNPLFWKKELAYYAKFGTPEQQVLIGKYQAATGEIIKDASRDFAGQFRKGEQSLLESMKPTASDTPDVAAGKIQSLTLMTKMLSERAKIMSDLIRKEGKTPIEAAEQADKLIDGNKIRQDIEDKLSPKITIRNKKTGEEKTVSHKEARKLLKKSGAI